MWWKNRLAEAGLMPAEKSPPSDVCVFTTLHTGGTWYSTPEELARLVFSDLPEFADTTATPGIARTPHRPEPIDAVAARVAHFPGASS